MSNLPTTPKEIADALHEMRRNATMVYNSAQTGPIYTMTATVPGLGVLTDAADLLEQLETERADLARDRGDLAARVIELSRQDALIEQLLLALHSYDLPIDTNNIALSCIEFGAAAVERELRRRAAIAAAKERA